jgi:hypothetical protein
MTKAQLIEELKEAETAMRDIVKYMSVDDRKVSAFGVIHVLNKSADRIAAKLTEANRR